MSPSSVASAQKSSRVTADVLAAGAVCWRHGSKGLEVVLIHRPKYNDWSWPKGKVDPGETLPETAVREVKEETGLDIRLGIPLPTAEYKVGGKNTKKVFYWSAEVRGDAAFAPMNEREVDRAKWFPVEKARTIRPMRCGPGRSSSSVTARPFPGRSGMRPSTCVRCSNSAPGRRWP